MFETDLRNLASLLIADAIKEGTPFEQRVDALKAGTTLYGLLLKHKELDQPEQHNGPSFLDFSEAVAEKEVKHGGTKAVRTGARAGPRRNGSSPEV